MTIPQNWIKVPLKELGAFCDLKNGFAFKSYDYQKVGIPLIKIGDFNQCQLDFSNADYLPEYFIDEYSRFLVNEDDLIIAMSGATTGKIAVVKKLDLPAFLNQRVGNLGRLNRKLIYEPYLPYLEIQLKKELMALAPGSAMPNISKPMIEQLHIYVPPLEEQQRIVAQIEELVGKIEEVRSLRQKALKETDILLTQAITTILDNDEWEELPLNKLLRENSLNGLSPRPSETPPGLPILRISAATSQADAIIDEADFKYLEVSEQDAVKYKLEPGDLLACRYNGNLHYTGKFALYKAYSGKQHLYPDKLIRFRVDTKNIMPEFACLALNSPKCRKIIESFCATTAGNIGLSAGNLKTVPVPVPPLLEQRRIVAYLNELQTKVDTMKRLREQAMKELNALLPSILDKAFKGEL